MANTKLSAIASAPAAATAGSLYGEQGGTSKRFQIIAAISDFFIASSVANALTALGITSAVAELNFVDGVTSNVQTQLDTKETKLRTTTEQALTFVNGGTTTMDLASGVNATLAMGATATTLGSPSNKAAGLTGTIKITQDATGGRTLEYHADWLFPGGVDPTLSTEANAVDILSWYCDGTKMYANLLNGFA